MNKTRPPLFDIKEEYNPKLEYLICKNIVSSFSEGFEEIHLRNCYQEIEPPNEELEKTMLTIKKFFEENNILTCKEAQLKVFYEESLNLEKVIDLKFFDELLTSTYPLFAAILHLFKIWTQKTISKKQDILFRLMFVILCLQKEKKLVIPYFNTVNKIKELVRNSAKEIIIKDLLQQLYFRTTQKNSKHALKLNKVIRSNVEENKDEFIKKIRAKYLGLIGSFALNQENEYSDFDLVVVMDKDFEELDIKQKTYLFWKKYIPIKMDIVVVKEDEMAEKMTVSMLKTFKRI